MFNEWCRIRDRHGVNDVASAHFVHQNVLSRADDMPNCFFRRLMVILITHVPCPLLSNTHTHNYKEKNHILITCDIIRSLACHTIYLLKGPMKKQIYHLSLRQPNGS